MTSVTLAQNLREMSAIDDLIETVARLRGPGGCPWDIEQTHQSLCDCLVEECAELLDTIDRLDYEHMREELGDLLLQVVMHAQMAREEQRFSFEEVAHDINDKLVRRHPHVFGDISLQDSEAVLAQWDKIKAAEKKNGPQPAHHSPFKHLPPKLPALLHARELYKQITKKNLPAENALDSDAIKAASHDLTEAEAGRRLFTIAAACRQAGIDPETALRRECSRIETQVSARAHQKGQ